MPAPSPLASEPLVITAGETIQWMRTIATFPPGQGFTPTYYFAGVDAFKLSGVSSGTGWLFTVQSSDLAAKKPGRYLWALYVEDSSSPVNRYRINTGVVEVTANITTANPGDLQTHEERTLAILIAACEGRLTADLEHYQVAGKAVAKIPIKELQALRVHYAWAVMRQKNPGKLGADVSTVFYPPDGTVGAPDPVVLPPWYWYTNTGG